MRQTKAILSMLGLILFFSVSFAYYSIEERQAYNYAYKYYITTTPSINQANMGGDLTRIAMAKMLSTYAINVLLLTPDTNKDCDFLDVPQSLDIQYDLGVRRACQLGLMGVGIRRFRPYDTVTRAEFGTVLSRALNAKDPDKLKEMNSAEPYYYKHLKYLKNEGIMNNISNPTSRLERRGRVMLMMMRADKNYEPEVIENYYSPNKIKTYSINTEGCDWMTRTSSPEGYEDDMPNKNWINDVKFVNKALQDVRDNGEYIVKNYIDEANRVLDSAGLTKRDQCRYSLLIDELEHQQGFIRSYKNENGNVTIGIDFISYKENITRDDWLGFDTLGDRWDIRKNTSTKVRYYTLSDNAELETVNVDDNGFLPKSSPRTTYTKFIHNGNTRLNNFCNNEPIYQLVSKDEPWGDEIEYINGDWYYNYNRGDRDGYCIKRQIESGGTSATFSFDNYGQVKKIMKTYYLSYCPWCS